MVVSSTNIQQPILNTQGVLNEQPLTTSPVLSARLYAVSYLNAGFDSHLTIEVFCPLNTPFPHPTNQGTLDLVNGSFVPNNTNTGVYMTAPVEVKLFRFINDMHLVGADSRNEINSPEPFLLNYPYFLRCTLDADPDITGPLKAAVTIGMFRKKTI